MPGPAFSISQSACRGSAWLQLCVLRNGWAVLKPEASGVGTYVQRQLRTFEAQARNDVLGNLRAYARRAPRSLRNAPECMRI